MKARIFTIEQFLQYFFPGIKGIMRTSYRQRNMLLTDLVFDTVQDEKGETYYFFLHNDGGNGFMGMGKVKVGDKKMNELLSKHNCKYVDEVIFEYLYDTPCEFDLEEDVFRNSDLFLFNQSVKLKVKVRELVSGSVFMLNSN